MNHKNKNEKYFAEKIYNLISEAEQQKIFISIVCEFGYCKIFMGKTLLITLASDGINTINNSLNRSKKQ